MENLEQLVSDEQLLELALSVIIRDDENETANKILLCYAVNHFEQKGIDPTNEELEEYMGVRFVEYVTEFLIREGMGEVEFDEFGNPDYKFTDEGQAVMLAIAKARFG